jgi:hypothetical protein
VRPELTPLVWILAVQLSSSTGSTSSGEALSIGRDTTSESPGSHRGPGQIEGPGLENSQAVVARRSVIFGKSTSTCAVLLK